MQSTSRSAPRRKPTQERSQARVETILNAASELIEQHGSAALRMNQLAAVAGVPIGSIYQYFPNRSAIIAALAERYIRGIHNYLINVTQQATNLAELREGLWSLMWRCYRETQEEPVFRDIWSGTEADRDIEHINLQDSRQSAEIMYQRYVALGGNSRDGRKRTDCLLICHLAGSAYRLALTLPNEEAEMLIQSFVDMCLDRLFLH